MEKGNLSSGAGGSVRIPYFKNLCERNGYPFIGTAQRGLAAVRRNLYDRGIKKSVGNTLFCLRNSAEFDIIHQIYQCRYCGQKVDANEPVERLKKWRALKRRHSGVNSGDIHPSVHICKNCGAEILIPEGEAVGRCEFCGGNLVRRAFTFRDNLPEVFILCPDRKEASERLTAWAVKK